MGKDKAPDSGKFGYSEEDMPGLFVLGSDGRWRPLSEVEPQGSRDDPDDEWADSDALLEEGAPERE